MTNFLKYKILLTLELEFYGLSLLKKQNW